MNADTMRLTLLLAAILLASCSMDKPELNLPGVMVLDQRLDTTSFKLLDHNGKEFNRDSLNGKWTLAFFGYTHCPDICPNTMLVMNAVHQALAGRPELADTRYVFFSVDPYRDTPAKLRDFVGYFNPEFQAVTGEVTQLQRLTGPLGAYFDYSDPGSDTVWQDVSVQPPIKDFLVNHAASIYLFDNKGRLAAYFMPPHEAEKIVTTYTAFRR